jgi:hypothetical protein
VSAKNPKDFCEICDFTLFTAQGAAKKPKFMKKSLRNFYTGFCHKATRAKCYKISLML